VYITKGRTCIFNSTKTGIMLERVLWIAGSLPFLLLGGVHLLYTFFTNKFSSRNSAVDEAMKTSHPVLTRQTTMWNAWIGFNASHSSGVIYIGLVNFLIAVFYPIIITNSLFLCVNLITVVFYLWLGKKYWFGVPFKGILISTCCFFSAALVVAFG